MEVSGEIDAPAALILGKNVDKGTISASFSDPVIVSMQMLPEHLREEQDPVLLPKY